MDHPSFEHFYGSLCGGLRFLLQVCWYGRMHPTSLASDPRHLQFEFLLLCVLVNQVYANVL